MKLGLGTYSLRSQGWDAFGYLEYAHDMGIDVVQFSERSVRYCQEVLGVGEKRVK